MNYSRIIQYIPIITCLYLVYRKSRLHLVLIQIKLYFNTILSYSLIWSIEDISLIYSFEYL